MKNSGSIAIIPARGGSKRIPRKNIVNFHGKPLIAWTIEAALESGVYEHVIVSTEDQEIADADPPPNAAPYTHQQHRRQAEGYERAPHFRRIAGIRHVDRRIDEVHHPPAVAPERKRP